MQRRARLNRVLTAVLMLALLSVPGCEEIEDTFVPVGSMRVFPTDPALRAYTLGGDGVQVLQLRLTRAVAQYDQGSVDLLGGSPDCPVVDTSFAPPTIDSDLPCELGIVVGESDRSGPLTLDVSFEANLFRTEPLLFGRNDDSDFYDPARPAALPFPMPDGFPNFVDKCPLMFDPGQEDEDPQDGLGDACQTENPFNPVFQAPDSDADGVADVVDNCIYIKNPNQVDLCELKDPDGCSPPFGIGVACPYQEAPITLNGSPTIDLTLTIDGFFQRPASASFLVIDLNNTVALQCDWAVGRCSLVEESVGFCVRTNTFDAQSGC